VTGNDAHLMAGKVDRTSKKQATYPALSNDGTIIGLYTRSFYLKVCSSAPRVHRSETRKVSQRCIDLPRSILQTFRMNVNICPSKPRFNPSSLLPLFHLLMTPLLVFPSSPLLSPVQPQGFHVFHEGFSLCIPFRSLYSAVFGRVHSPRVVGQMRQEQGGAQESQCEENGLGERRANNKTPKPYRRAPYTTWHSSQRSCLAHCVERQCFMIAGVVGSKDLRTYRWFHKP
jgi:hypothetical protein